MILRSLLKIIIVRPQNKQYKKPISFINQLFSECSCKLNFRSVYTTNDFKAVSKYAKYNDDCKSHKAAIIASLNLRSAEDAALFYALPINILYQIQKTTLNDRRNGFCENRLYYISSQIQCPPAALVAKLAKRSFVYKLPFEWLRSSLNELLDKGVSGDRILRDLWVLRYHHKTIRERLQRIKDNGVVNLYPWMVRCSPHILNRYLRITQETKNILGDTKSTQMYLANRLNLTIEEVEDMCIKFPALKTIRVAKVKHFLDFLVDEGFNIEEIAKKPRILASSQKTVKQRLQQLRLLGVTDINLNLLCRSKKDYERVIETLEAGLR